MVKRGKWRETLSDGQSRVQRAAGGASLPHQIGPA